MSEKYYDTIERALEAMTEVLKAGPAVPSDYCRTCVMNYWPTIRSGPLSDIINSLTQTLKTYSMARSFLVENIDRGLADPVKGGVCLTVFFQQHCTRFFVCPSGQVCYACGPEDWH